MYIYIYMYITFSAKKTLETMVIGGASIYIYIHTYIYIYTYIHTYIHTYIYIYIRDPGPRSRSPPAQWYGPLLPDLESFISKVFTAFWMQHLLIQELKSIVILVLDTYTHISYIYTGHLSMPYTPLVAGVPRGGKGWGGVGCNNVHVTCVKGWGGVGLGGV